jgi:hypothetical protein
MTAPADWLLTFRSVRQELRNPGLGNRETRGGWLVREAALESVTMSLCDIALVELVERGVLEPVRYAAAVGAPLFAPDPGRGCGASMYPREEPYGWHARKSPAWAWVYRVPPFARGHEPWGGPLARQIEELRRRGIRPLAKCGQHREVS